MPERAQRRVGDLADTQLQRGAVLDEARDELGDVVGVLV